MYNTLQNNRWIAAAVLTVAAVACIFASMTVFAATTPVTDPATGITMSDATLNGTNGDTDATASAFWVATSTFAVASSSSPILPADVYSTGDIGPVASSTAFSALLSSATIPAGLLPITPGTTYYFTAWTEVGGVWTPGAVLNFTTLASAPTVTGVSPTSGTTLGGTVVTVSGTDLTGASAVRFGTTTATGVIVSSSTSLTAISPAGSAGIVDVTVTTPSGTSATSSADQFTYVAPVVLPAAPVISNVAASSSATSTATVSWTTDTAATGQVFYGTTTSYGSSSALNLVASTTHSIDLSNLTEATLYHYQVVSTNAGGTATSSDQVFTTGSTSSSTPLAVTSIDAVDTTATADGTYANGWKYIFNLTLPSNEPNVAMKFSDWSSGANTIAAANNMRISSAQADNAGATITILAANTYTIPDLHMTGDLDPATPGIQVQVVVEVKIPSGTTDSSYTTTYGIRSQ